MTKNPSWKLLEVFVLMILQVIRILHISKCQWEPGRGVRNTEDIGINYPSNDPNTLALQRMGRISEEILVVVART